MIKNVVIDIETLGTKLNKRFQPPVVLSIGAVVISDGKITSEFEGYLNIDDQIAKGAYIDSDTLQWWVKTDPLLFSKTLDKCAAASTLSTSLDFTAWFSAQKPDDVDYIPIWGNSHSFDCTNLEYIYTMFEIERPWSYRGESCFRTLKKLCSWEIKPKGFQGTKHNCLDDARHEAEWLIACAKHLNKVI